MPDAQQHRRPSAGKEWRQYRAGNPAGQPLAEWAYFTPRYPDGIGINALREVDADIQVETMVVWFGLNLEPYALDGGPYFAFDAPGKTRGYGSGAYGSGVFGAGLVGSAGLDEGVWVPTPLNAQTVLFQEFGLLAAALRARAAEVLPGEWMWRQAPALAPINSPGDLTDLGELGRAILTRLDAMEASLRELRPAHGEMGHNGPPEEVALALHDHGTIEVEIARVRKALTEQTQASAHDLRSAADWFEGFWPKLAAWALKQADTFASEANKAFASKLPTIINVWILSHYMKELPAFLQAAAQLLRHG